jgi:hypothetical protein
VESIGDFVFRGCTALERVVIGNGVTCIERGMFSDCTALSEVSIPDSVTRIEKEAFWGCTSLKTIVVPQNAAVADDAFDKGVTVTRGH